MASIRSIALKAREIVEREAKKNLFPGDLQGFCGRGTAILYKEFNKAGIKARIHVAFNPNYTFEQHIFLRVQNSIVDITATQFNKEPVTVIPIWGKKPWFWQRHYEFESIKELAHFQKVEGWPREQIADIS